MHLRFFACACIVARRLSSFTSNFCLTAFVLLAATWDVSPSDCQLIVFFPSSFDLSGGHSSSSARRAFSPSNRRPRFSNAFVAGIIPHQRVEASAAASTLRWKNDNPPVLRSEPCLHGPLYRRPLWRLSTGQLGHTGRQRASSGTVGGLRNTNTTQGELSHCQCDP